MSTMATLNLPATTSGIWRLAPPWAPVPAQLDGAADEPFGAAEPLLTVPEQAPTMTTAAVSNDSSRRRDVTMDSPPRRALGRVRTSVIECARKRDPEGGAARFPAGTVARRIIRDRCPLLRAFGDACRACWCRGRNRLPSVGCSNGPPCLPGPA